MKEGLTTARSSAPDPVVKKQLAQMTASFSEVGIKRGTEG
jgi:hypothetical protein